MATFYSIRDILTVGHIHPFYTPSLKYPPSSDEIAAVLKDTNGPTNIEHLVQPLLWKEHLYKIIERLYVDKNPENHYRANSYISITGGGSGKSLPMIFLTDVEDNYNQRLAMSQLMRACKMVERTDWVLNIHPGGFLYRALDLSTQNIEQAGGSVLCAGYVMPHERSVAVCIKYCVNVITGDSPHVLNFAHFVASLPQTARTGLKITKIIYTCEMMSLSKRRYLRSVFGPVSIFSMFASAETGPWAVAVLGSDTTDKAYDDGTTDFLYDTRAMKVEVLSLDSKIWISEPNSPPKDEDFSPEGTAGHLVLTSLQRLKNPLIRYVSGDVGSLHSLPASSYPQIEPEMRKHLGILRLHGRDKRFSFKWVGEYFDFEALDRVMQTEEWGILQWQIIIETGKDWEGSDSLELRLMRRLDDGNILTKEKLLECFYHTFFLNVLNEKLFAAVFLDNLDGFVRSETSNKIVPFIDRRISRRLARL